ncbi:MAG: hypothetical protein KA945_12075 [Zoogloea sp.]|nr:hypothetical protein [Zoogloea sp.]
MAHSINCRYCRQAHPERSLNPILSTPKSVDFFYMGSQNGSSNIKKRNFLFKNQQPKKHTKTGMLIAK